MTARLVLVALAVGALAALGLQDVFTGSAARGIAAILVAIANGIFLTI